MGAWVFQQSWTYDPNQNGNETPAWQWPQNETWTWEPESQTPLTSPPITAGQFEETAMNLWGEFLNGYFNEQLHFINNLASPILFPAARLVFQQNEAPQPVEGTFIHIILADPGKIEERVVDGQYQAWQRIMLEFYVRANTKENLADGSDRDILCSRVADRLYGLLQDRGASIPLQEKGFRYIRPTPPGIRYDTNYSTRCIRCSMMCVFDTAASNVQNGGQVGILGGD